MLTKEETTATATEVMPMISIVDELFFLPATRIYNKEHKKDLKLFITHPFHRKVHKQIRSIRTSPVSIIKLILDHM